MLSAFKDYLTQKALVKDEYIPFYLKWVSDGYSFLSEPNSAVLNPEQTNRFQKYLAKTHEDWQVKQTSNALRLYSYYLTSLQKEMHRLRLQRVKANGICLKHGRGKPSGSDTGHIVRKGSACNI
ncbi:MAG: hypothetical protein QY317_12055 [Candidatus Jettenia caeni]|nr:MAG: hypothetical protein QY317_12055 [Candidatus Jettenia caeni]